MPLPLPDALTYAVPAGLAVPPQVGSRVKVEVGRRRLVGVVMALSDQAPEAAHKIKPILEVLDVEPAVPENVLALADFAARYYLAPIGESVRLTVPNGLPPWGERRVSLTNAGALAPRREPAEAVILDYLLEHRRVRLAELSSALEVDGLPQHLERLERLGLVSVEVPGQKAGGRYVRAVELAPGDFEEQREKARSKQARAVLDDLRALGRPATVRDVAASAECGVGVIRRLIKLGLLREFTQPERLVLDRHRLGGKKGDGDPIVLRPDQQTAVEALHGALDAATYAPFLLHGVTGAGKTEVYLRAVERCLAGGRSAILMVPEIALVPALASAVRRRFGRDLALLHSNLGSAERQQEWERIRRGEARVVLGPRSALFAPVASLGLVVVDEEHDSAYKQDRSPRYHGRDLALWRARDAGAAAVLVSATPSLESRYNAEVGKLGLLKLTERAGPGSLPRGVLVDLRKEDSAGKGTGEIYFSGPLLQELRRTLDAGDQAILLRNRRGYAPVLLCRACGEDFRCEDCGLAMTFHRRGTRLSCHYCGDERPAPRRCPACDEPALEPIGAGTERVEERFRELFPGVAVDVLDADASRRTGGAAAVLERFSRGDTQVLIGTQMVAKGHHFPRVSLAAVLFADTYLRFPDFRAVERTYALLTQLAGRAGRGERPGTVVIQTYHPDHYAIRAALEHDDAVFAEMETRFRRSFQYPPYSRMILVLSQHKESPRALDSIRQLAAAILRDPRSRDLRVLGPVAAPLERLRGRWRFQLGLRGPSGARLRQLVTDALEKVPATVRGDLVVDVDPQDLL
ncbi:MAG: primosomal protein N' [Acidobacteriota bacterium]